MNSMRKKTNISRKFRIVCDFVMHSIITSTAHFWLRFDNKSFLYTLNTLHRTLTFVFVFVYISNQFTYERIGMFARVCVSAHTNDRNLKF